MTIIPMRPGGMGQAVATLTAAATALFLLCGRLPAPYNRWTRNAALAIYGLTVVGVLVYLGLWSFGVEF